MSGGSRTCVCEDIQEETGLDASPRYRKEALLRLRAAAWKFLPH